MKYINYIFIFLYIVFMSPFLVIGGLACGAWAGLRGGWNIMHDWIDNWP